MARGYPAFTSMLPHCEIDIAAMRASASRGADGVQELADSSLRRLESRDSICAADSTCDHATDDEKKSERRFWRRSLSRNDGVREGFTPRARWSGIC
ncbi:MULTISPECIES: hypothetical protein [unclassified Bradyrhizobium]|uniref:hypothetical protein n=1 Tax=unclassified Bradyrhizobium TaxID=2631580 RepID=UPI001FF28BC1|nr:MULTISPECIES: hypothetical protein [unclassified Bradyrhizobium]MCJ9703809.1 hypothetical protein [Bradyrhizobium sp. SHOUNA76]MCJ9734338.1 hypothetical protein [Bradyrhizobium sp. PRIMUS42]